MSFFRDYAETERKRAERALVVKWIVGVLVLGGLVYLAIRMYPTIQGLF